MGCENCNHSREGWGRGPWDDEPDSYRFDSYGFPCFMHRGPMGAWCGYVAVPREHKCYGLDYDAVYEVAPGISVHGGLTYADAGNTILDFVTDHWIFGFDTCHGGDYWPSMGKMRQDHLAMLELKGEPPDNLFDWHEWDDYRDFYYVLEYVEGLARNLALV